MCKEREGKVMLQGNMESNEKCNQAMHHKNVWFKTLLLSFKRKMAKQYIWMKFYRNIWGSPNKDIRSFRFFPKNVHW